MQRPISVAHVMAPSRNQVPKRPYVQLVMEKEHTHRFSLKVALPHSVTNVAVVESRSSLASHAVDQVNNISK